MMPRDADRIADPSAADARRAVLLGRDHVGQAAAATAASADGAVAVGIARGWRPKRYPCIDPNEDAVGGVAGGRAQLLVVADGHNGLAASHRAVQAVIELLGADPRPADLTDDELIAVALRVERQVAVGVRSKDPRPRTTLVVALRTPAGLQWFGIGDSTLFIVDEGRAWRPTARTRWFLGDRLDAAAMRRSLARGRKRIPAAAWVVLATDGYTDFLGAAPSAAVAVADAVADSDDPRRAAGALLEQARRGGAGDNVGVAVSGPWYKAHDGLHNVLDHDR